MTLRLKDISNLPPNLPGSQIPQQFPTSSSYSKQLQRDQWPMHGASGGMKEPSCCLQQQRVAALSGGHSACELMDDSLTDMQWLQRMDAGSGFPGLTHGYKRMGVKNIRPGNKDGCRKKLEYNNGSKKDTNKPPLSYASLIALAICSTPQRMMTLSNIYRWIEYTFPFYRTPEAKAWKNSIRHNLSIRKNMFMKVYQYPPRRGNGSYWTLLSDGEEELKKAVPLFATLQPPVIDTNCAYHREPSTYTVKSKGKFVPVLPRSDDAANHSYFSLSGNLPSGMKGCSHEILASDEVVVGEGDASEFSSSRKHQVLEEGNHKDVTLTRNAASCKRSWHLEDHSYAKGLSLRDVDDLMDRSLEAEVVELAAGAWDKAASKSSSDDSFSTLSTPKRKRKMTTPVQTSKRTMNSTGTLGDSVRHLQVSEVSSVLGDSPSFNTPIKEEDNSLHLLDSSLLTPLKNMVSEGEMTAVSFSPLYPNFATPKQEKFGRHGGQILTGDTRSQTLFPSPFTPLKGSFDSGIFSPLRTDSLVGMKFSTPTNMSPLQDLNSFSSLHPELCPLKVLDGSGISTTPLRPGSLQAFGLPGLTPPSRK